MIEYQLSQKTRAQMSQDPAVIKAAICAIANRSFGIQDNLSGIFKSEGGVLVNNREIAIHTNCVQDDCSVDRKPTPEEQAVIDAIATVATIIEKAGIRPIRKEYGTCRIGDPLRALLKHS